MQQRRWRWLRAAGWILQPRGRGLEFGRWGFGPLPSGKHRRRWRRLGGWRALGRGAPTVSTLPWSLGSIRRVRCFPNWGSRKARRHLGRWRWRWRWAAGWILQPRGRGLDFGRWWFGPLPNGKHRRRGRWRRLGGWRALGWQAPPTVCTSPWTLGSIRKVRCFPWGSRKARRHHGRWRLGGHWQPRWRAPGWRGRDAN